MKYYWAKSNFNIHSEISVIRGLTVHEVTDYTAVDFWVFGYAQCHRIFFFFHEGTKDWY